MGLILLGNKKHIGYPFFRVVKEWAASKLELFFFIFFLPPKSVKLLYFLGKFFSRNFLEAFTPQALRGAA